MDNFEYGACFSVLLRLTLTIQERTLISEFDNYLLQFKNQGYSFMHEYKAPVFTKFEKKQLLETIGYIPEEEISMCGLATPLFRSIEAILNHFGGYAMIRVGDIFKEQPKIKGKCFDIRRSRSDPNYQYNKRYQLIDSEMISSVYNLSDPPEIKEIYSIQNFISLNK